MLCGMLCGLSLLGRRSLGLACLGVSQFKRGCKSWYKSGCESECKGRCKDQWKSEYRSEWKSRCRSGILQE